MGKIINGINDVVAWPEGETSLGLGDYHEMKRPIELIGAPANRMFGKYTIINDDIANNFVGFVAIFDAETKKRNLPSFSYFSDQCFFRKKYFAYIKEIEISSQEILTVSIVKKCCTIFLLYIMSANEAGMSIEQPITQSDDDLYSFNCNLKATNLAYHISFLQSASSFSPVPISCLDTMFFSDRVRIQIGDLVNWTIPKKNILAVGCAMDFIHAITKKFVLPEYTTKNNKLVFGNKRHVSLINFGCFTKTNTLRQH